MKKVLGILTNKFVITGAVFAIWVIYFDQNSWLLQRQKTKEVENVERNIAYLNDEIAKMEHEYQELTTNPEKLEQYARERYKMKRDNEDLYIIE